MYNLKEMVKRGFGICHGTNLFKISITAGCAASLAIIVGVSTSTLHANSSSRTLSLKNQSLGKVTDAQGLCFIRPSGALRWTPLSTGLQLQSGDAVKTDPRGANAFQLRFANGSSLIAGPNSLLRVHKGCRVDAVRGEVEFNPGSSRLQLLRKGKDDFVIKETQLLKFDERNYTPQTAEPNWLKYFKGTITHESMGSLMAKVDGRNVPLTIGYHKVTVDIHDQIARTVIEESFVNHTSGTLEGTFHFPLPHDASISGFGMWINGELVEADVVEKRRAREIYETILRERRDPGLLEWSGGSIFKARVFPIFGHSEKRIKITYTQVLPKKGESYRYSYALQSDMLRENPLKELDITVNVHSSVSKINSVTCLSHPTDNKSTDHSASVKFNAQEYTPASDFELDVELADDTPILSVIPHRRGDNGYFMMMLAPKGKSNDRDMLPDGKPLDIIILADTSASIGAEQRKAQDLFVASLLSCLKPGRDRWRLAAIDVNCNWFKSEKQTIDGARNFLSKRHSLGWTDLPKALSSALKRAAADTHIIYIGDGANTTGEADPVSAANALEQLYKGKGNVHVIANGNSIEPMVVKAMASLGNGTHRNLKGSANASLVSTELLQELITPGITDLNIEFEEFKAARIYPEKLPNLAMAKQLIILGRYLPEGEVNGSVKITGCKGDKKVTCKAPFVVDSEESGNSFIARLWARRHLDMLLEQGKSQATKDEVIELSERFHIMTPYTSFLVLESDEDRERFGVKKNLVMKDGERYFAKGRTEANYELKQQQMKLAKAHRQNIRRRILKQLLKMGRYEENAQPAPYKFSGRGGELLSAPKVVATSGATSSMRMMVNSSSLTPSEPMVEIERPDVVDGFELFETPPMGSTRRMGNEGFEELDELLDMEESEEAMPAMEAYADDKSSHFMQFAKRSVRKERLAEVAWKSDMSLGAKGNWDFDSITPHQNRYKLSSGKPEPQPIYWLNSFFPNMVKQRVDAKSTWGKDATDLCKKLLLKNKQVKGNLSWVLDEQSFNNKGEVNSSRQFNGVLSDNKWTWALDQPASLRLKAFCDGTTETVWYPIYKTGRSRKSAEHSLDQFVQGLGSSLQHLSTPFFETYFNYSVKSLTAESGQVVLELVQKNQTTPRSIQLTIDTKRNVLLSKMYITDGKEVNKTVYSNHLEVGGVWWPGLIRYYGKDEKLYREEKLALNVVDSKKTADLLEAAASESGSLVIYPETFSGVDKAKGRIKKGDATFMDYIVVLNSHMQLNRSENILKTWKLCENKFSDEPLVPWLKLEVLQSARRNQEVLNAVEDNLSLVKSAPINEQYALAQRMLNKIQYSSNHHEALALLEKLKRFFADLHPWLTCSRTWKQAKVQLLLRARQIDQALALEKEICKKYPDDIYLQMNHIRNHFNNRRVTEGLKLLASILAPESRYTQEQRNEARNNSWYYIERHLSKEAFHKFVDEWAKDKGDSLNFYQAQLKMLYIEGKVDAAEKLVKQWLTITSDDLNKKANDTPSSRKLEIALNHLVDNNLFGYSYNNLMLDPKWITTLENVVSSLYLNKRYNRHANKIMTHRKFIGYDECRKLRRKLFPQIIESSLELDPNHLQTLLNWYDAQDVMAQRNLWDALIAKVKAHEYRKMDDAKAELTIHIGYQPENTLMFLFRKIDDKEQALSFLRRQVEKARPINKRFITYKLYRFLLTMPWSEQNEKEIWSLWKQIHTQNEKYTPDQLVGATYQLDQLVDRLIEMRHKSLSPSGEQSSNMSRKQLSQRNKSDKKQAREAVLKALESEIDRLPHELATLFVQQQLYLKVVLRKDRPALLNNALKDLLETPPFWLTEAGADLENINHTVWLIRQLDTIILLAPQANEKQQQALENYLNTQVEGKDREFFKGQLFRYLVVADKPQALLKALQDWCSEENVTTQMRLNKAYLLAELNRLQEAVEVLKSLQCDDLLGFRDIQILSKWLLVLDKKDEYNKARIDAWSLMPEHQLRTIIWGQQRQWRQRNGSAPFILTDETFDQLSALFKKSLTPQNHLYMLSDFYRANRDFRLFRCLTDSMSGMSQQQVYPYLKEIVRVCSHINEEATVESVVDEINKLRGSAKTNLDRRALDLLELVVARRAAEVLDQPQGWQHKALSALKRPFNHSWQNGEQRLMAEFLSSLGAMKSEALKMEHLRQHATLAKSTNTSRIDQLHITISYAQTLRAYGRASDAADLLEQALQNFRNSGEGYLTGDAEPATRLLVSLLQEKNRHKKLEIWLKHEMSLMNDAHQIEKMNIMILQNHVSAVRKRTMTSLGSGQQLFTATRDLLATELKNQGLNYCQQVMNISIELFNATEKNKDDINGLRNFVFTSAKSSIDRDLTGHRLSSMVGRFARLLHDKLSDSDAVEFFVICFETEPIAKQNSYNSCWRQSAHRLAEYRSRIPKMSDELSSRLLAVVKKQMIKQLELSSNGINNLNMCWKGRSYFWTEKANDFSAVAESVLSQNMNRGRIVENVAEYLFNGLELRPRAIEILLDADQRDVLRISGRKKLVQYLQHEGRYAESIAPSLSLSVAEPKTIGIRCNLIKAYALSGKTTDALEALEQATSDFKKFMLWNTNSITVVAKACLDGKLYQNSADLYRELIALTKSSYGLQQRTARSLSTCYRFMSQAYINLKDTANAVDAACGAIVCWGRDKHNRNNAMRNLHNVLRRAQDLNNYVESFESEVAKTNQGNPILRQALAKVYESKGDWEKCKYHCLEALKDQPNDKQTHDLVLRAYDKLKDPEGAIAHLYRYVKAFRRDMKLYKTFYERLRKMEQKIEAERVATSIVELLPLESESHAMYALILQGENRYDDALFHWSRVNEIRPREPSGLLGLAKAQIRLKQWTEANKTLDKVISTAWPDRFRNAKHEALNLQRNVEKKLTAADK